MTDDIDDIKKELEEVRKLKEELRREVEDVRREKEDAIRREADEVRRGSDVIKGNGDDRRGRPPRAPRAPRPPRHVRPVRPIRELDIDLGGITDSLEDMMEGLGKSIEMSLKGVEGIGTNIRVPGVRIHRTGRKGRKVRKSDIEKIPPERVAKIVAPLGSEERLRILEFLKDGGKTFNEIEVFTAKTGSSLTHHLNPLVEASYVVKGEVRGTYYLTVEGRLAYRLAQWLTHRVESQRMRTGNNGSNGEVSVDFEDDDDTVVIVEDEEELEKAAEHLDRVAEEVDEVREKIEAAAEEIEEAKEAHLERLEELEEERLEQLEDLEDEEADDLDDLDWEN